MIEQCGGVWPPIRVKPPEGQNTALCHDAVWFTSIEVALEPLQAVTKSQGNQAGVHSQHDL